MEPNIQLLDKIIKIIGENPEYWNQEYWHCGTTHCLAGHIELYLDGLPPNTYIGENSCAHDLARDVLGISDEDATTLFYWLNTLDDIIMYRDSLAKHGKIMCARRNNA